MRRRLTVLAVTCVMLIVAGCARPEPQPTIESPQQGANRVLAGILQEEPDPEYPAPYGPDAVAGKPMPVIDGYFPGVVPVAWVVRNDVRVPANGIFASMQPATTSETHYAVPILQGGEPVSEFDIKLDSGEWIEGARLAETEPAGYFYEVLRIEGALRAELGPETETRVALFLPSGLVFVVGNNGSTELAAYLTFENSGAGIAGYDKYLPQTGDLYGPEDLRGLLDPHGPSPRPVEQ